MKKLFAILLAILMLFSLAACKDDTSDEEKIVVPNTTGGHFVNVFLNNVNKSAQEIADSILADSGFKGHVGTTSNVEEGTLVGFGDAEITGFKKGVMFKSNSVRLPFVGYVFELSSGTDVEKFKQNLLDNADLNFNGITSADEVIVQEKGDKVVVVITPDKIDDVPTKDENGNPVEGEMPIYGDDFVDEFEE